MVDSCRTATSCREGEEQSAAKAPPTYNGVDRITGEPTYGGYSKHIVVARSSP